MGGTGDGSTNYEAGLFGLCFFCSLSQPPWPGLELFPGLGVTTRAPVVPSARTPCARTPRTLIPTRLPCECPVCVLFPVVPSARTPCARTLRPLALLGCPASALRCARGCRRRCSGCDVRRCSGCDAMRCDVRRCSGCDAMRCSGCDALDAMLWMRCDAMLWMRCSGCDALDAMLWMRCDAECCGGTPAETRDNETMRQSPVGREKNPDLCRDAGETMRQ